MFEINYLRTAEQIQFIDDLALWLEDGQAANHALAGMKLLALERGNSKELKVIESLRIALAKGKPLASGMRPFFNYELTMLVEIGQKAGCLPDLLSRYQAYTQRRRNLVKACLKSMLYPLFLFFAAIIALVFVGTQIIPRFQQFDAGSELPLTIRSITIFAELLIAIFPILLLLAAIVAIALRYTLEHWHSPRRQKLEWLLPFSVFKTYNGIYLLQGISLLLRSQMGLERALRMFESRSSVYLARHLTTMRASLAAGEVNLHKIFNTGLFNNATLYRLQFAATTQENKANIFALLANRLIHDGERTIWLHQKGVISLLYTLSVLCILWILVSMGLLFNELAKSWS